MVITRISSKMYRLTYPQFNVLLIIHLLEDVGTTLPISRSERHSLRRNIHFLFEALDLATFAETCNTGSQDMNLDSHYGHEKQYTYSYIYINIFSLSLALSLPLVYKLCTLHTWPLGTHGTSRLLNVRGIVCWRNSVIRRRSLSCLA
jgi:hypothetical protein